MTWSVRIRRSALRELERVPKPHRLRVVETLDPLAESPHAGALLKGGRRGLRRRRVGRYRVIYEVRDRDLVVLAIRAASRGPAHRSIVGRR